MKKSSILYIFFLFIPIAIVLRLVNADTTIQFIVAAVALIPLSKMIGDSTENLSLYYGMTIGSLLMVTLGNSTEIIVGIVSISEGLFDLVKGTMIGGILANILLIPGLSSTISAIRYREQRFEKEQVELQSSMLLLSIVGLNVPTIIAISLLLHTNGSTQINLQLASDVVAFLLLGIYIASLVFTLFFQKSIFADVKGQDKTSTRERGWSKKRSLLFLILSVIGIAIVSGIMVDSVEAVGQQLGLTELFIGAVIVGIVGNAAEHTSAISFALKGKMNLSLSIGIGSGTQLALFVIPLLVIFGIISGQHFTLDFTFFELLAVFFGILIVGYISRDGSINWLEGLMVTVVYIIIAIGFFFLPNPT